MDAVHIHLMLTHFPIIGTLLAIGVLLYGLIIRSDQVKIAALGLMVAMALVAIPVFLTGEGAEEAVEHLAGVSETIIEAHEELAEKAIWLMGALGVISLINLVLIARKAAVARVLTFVTLLAASTTFGVFAKVGNLGGQIRHSEIRTTDIHAPANGLEKPGNFEYDDD